ncbi:MAG TPA: hypothetical protein VER03_11765 [Bryobacteraceae bacterium]|nr:hypothetical protein [Bryobacteraceae bacterium]
MQGSIVTSIAPELKAKALQEVLESATFSRAEQLRSFLRLVCEMEMSGRAAAITEYLIGVEGLGRSADFVPSTDGIVRSRAHALRQKLFEYYTKENPHAPLRIDLPKGSYVPKYIPADEPEFVTPAPAGFAAAVNEADAPVVLPAPPEPVSRWKTIHWREIGIGVVVGALLLFGLNRAFHATPATSDIDPLVAEAWGPLARPDADALIVLERPDQYIVRSLPPGADLAGVVNVAPPDAIRVEHERLVPPVPGQELRMSRVSAYRNGGVLGMAAALKVLNLARASVQILPEQNAPISNLRGRNALIFGDPTIAPTVARLLARGVYGVEYDKSVRDFVIRERGKDGAAVRTYYPKNIPEELDEYPGLITVLPSDGADNRKRVVVFAAGNSVGSQAAAEFFASPRGLRELKERFRSEKIDGFPRAYQVVVMGRSAGPALLSFTYIAHRVLDTPGF